MDVLLEEQPKRYCFVQSGFLYEEPNFLKSESVTAVNYFQSLRQLRMEIINLVRLLTYLDKKHLR